MKARVNLSATTDTRAYDFALKSLMKDAFPEAYAETLNRTAEAVTKEQIRTVKNKMMVRTKYTLNSMTSNRARPYKSLVKAFGKNVERMYSEAGTFSKYLWMHDKGKQVSGLDGGAVPIATVQARTGKNISKSIRKTYRLSSSQSLADGAVGTDSKMFIGKPKGGNRRRGLYLRSNNNKRLVMLRNLENQRVKIKGMGFHSSAVKKYGTKQFIEAQYFKAAQKRLRSYK